MSLLRLHSRDSVSVTTETIGAGSVVDGLQVISDTPTGHKIATRDIAQGEAIFKYGREIGVATQRIAKGEHVHSHNLSMGSTEDRTATIQAELPSSHVAAPTSTPSIENRETFLGYARANGSVGTRNYLGILTSVNCSATVAKRIAAHFDAERISAFPNVDGVIALTHSGGCAMSDGDEGAVVLRRTIAGYADHPNFAASLLLGLGCEANQIGRIVPLTSGNITATTIQDEGGTKAAIARGIAEIERMLPQANEAQRTLQHASKLVVGLQCGGSDGWSGITANPALGLAMDVLIANGGTAILSETPEIYGAEYLLTSRAEPSIAAQLIARIEWWQRYAERQSNTLDNNPSPGNKLGGITTILEKSLGAVAKGGSSPLRAVVHYADPLPCTGLVFMDSPGYDPVSATGQIASGANLLCFTTGRGSVFGAKPVPSLKLSTTTQLYRRMSDDIDVNCGTILDGAESLREVASRIYAEILDTASGKLTKSEELGFGEEEFQPWMLNSVL
jgi:altronate hydrolase